MALRFSYRFIFITLILVLLLCFLLNLSLGSVSIPWSATFQSLTGGAVEQETWRQIVVQYRLPKSITALLVGAGLGLSGVLMQTLFKNPLAGPYVLGLSSGSSLGVAIVIMGAQSLGGSTAIWLVSKWSITLAACLGCLLVLLAVLLVARRIQDTMTLLIVGLMFSSITASLVSILSYTTSAEQLQYYTFWKLGSLGHLTWMEIGILSVLFCIGTALAIVTIKPLNTLLLGERYASSLGIHVKKNRLLIIIATSLLAGGITAFAGPIAFIGLAVPHLTKQLFRTSDHKIIIPAVLCIGSITMLICDSIAQIPNSETTLPINAVTSLVGAPVVIWLLLRKRKMLF